MGDLLLVGVSFLVILAIVNSLGVIASAGVGIAEKLCTFLMLVPIAFMQSMTAFVAQNRGAGRPDRAVQALKYAVLVSCAFGFTMGLMSFFNGKMLAGSLFAIGLVTPCSSVLQILLCLICFCRIKKQGNHHPGNKRSGKNENACML